MAATYVPIGTFNFDADQENQPWLTTEYFSEADIKNHEVRNTICLRIVSEIFGSYTSKYPLKGDFAFIWGSDSGDRVWTFKKRIYSSIEPQAFIFHLNEDELKVFFELGYKLKFAFKPLFNWRQSIVWQIGLYFTILAA